MKALSRPAMWIGTFALILLGMALLTTVIPYRQILDQQARVDGTREELTRVEAENARLEQEVGALNTPQEIERLAREKLGYVMPGESAFVVLAPGEAPPPPESSSAAEDPVPWYVDIWNFLTGADLGGG